MRDICEKVRLNIFIKIIFEISLQFFEESNSFSQKRENFRPESLSLDAEEIFALFMDLAKNDDFPEIRKVKDSCEFFPNVSI